MAATTGPLMSLDASGTIAKTITFSKWKGRSYVRTRVIPHNPRSATQTATRAVMTFLTRIWTAMPIDPTTWLPLADSKKISAFNEFVSYNMAQFTQFLFPSTTYPAARVQAGVAMFATSANGGVKQITGSMQGGANANSFGYAVSVYQGSGTPVARDNIRLVVPATNAQIVPFTITGLAAGTWYIRTANFNLDGSIGAFVAEVGPLAVTAV